MKTLKEHNDERRALQSFLDATGRASGLACDFCGEEMQYTSDAINPSNPPKREVRCQCGYRGWVLA